MADKVATKTLKTPKSEREIRREVHRELDEKVRRELEEESKRIWEEIAEMDREHEIEMNAFRESLGRCFLKDGGGEEDEEEGENVPRTTANGPEE